MVGLSPAFRRFEMRLDEVKHLRLLSTKYYQLSTVVGVERSAHISVLMRSATVLLSSHIQGFVEDLSDIIVERLVQDSVPSSKIPDSLRYHATRSKLRELQSKQDSADLVASVRNYASSYSDIITLSGTASLSFLGSEYKDGFGNPTVKAIKSYLKRFGFVDYESEMRRRLKGDWNIVENAINQIVDRRNKIAHGDSLATLTPSEMREYIDLARKFCATTDGVTTKHFRSMGCTF